MITQQSLAKLVFAGLLATAGSIISPVRSLAAPQLQSAPPAHPDPGGFNEQIEHKGFGFSRIHQIASGLRGLNFSVPVGQISVPIPVDIIGTPQRIRDLRAPKSNPPSGGGWRRDNKWATDGAYKKIEPQNSVSLEEVINRRIELQFRQQALDSANLFQLPNLNLRDIQYGPNRESTSVNTDKITPLRNIHILANH